jgi:hypothetical protein
MRRMVREGLEIKKTNKKFANQVESSGSVDVEDGVEADPVSVEEEFGHLARKVLVAVAEDLVRALRPGTNSTNLKLSN